MDDFLWRALVAGIAVAAAAGPLGVFVVWRRMAYFGETLAHSALLGVAFGIVVGIDLTAGVVVVCAVLAFLLVALERRPGLATDTLLGVIAHGALALGVVLIAVTGTVRVDLLTLLLGDLLAVGGADLYWLLGGGAFILVTLGALWRPLLSATVHEELARVEGVPVFRVRLALTLMLAVAVGVAMKIVGLLLITSLLIIPAAAARRLASTPEQMAVLAGLIGALAVIGGLAGSLAWDLPSAPAVVVAAAVMFALATAWPAGGIRRPR